MKSFEAMPLFFVSISLALTAALFQLIQKVQSEPYMDEVFHIPQAQQYCQFNFTHWDPMITTLPGLYIATVSALLLVSNICGLSLISVCTTQNLRTFNLIFYAGNFMLLYFLGKKLNINESKETSKWQHSLQAAVLSLFPVLYFFSWLYYTDPGSTFFTLLMYLFCLHKCYKLSFVSGVGAILFRQTNIVWGVFCLALCAVEVVEKDLQSLTKSKLNQLSATHVIKLLCQVLLHPAKCLGIIKNVLIQSYWYVLLMFAFIAFLILNKGIVVGDRSNHEVSYNFPQVFYFSLVSLALSFLHFLKPQALTVFVQAFKKNLLKFILLVACFAVLVKYFTYEHKYLVSDNRHYTFYVWSKLFRRFEWVRFALIPIYIFSFYQFFRSTAHKGILWQLCLSVCIAACLVPQSLLEFRYYIFPFYIIRLNMKLPSVRILLIELLFYVCINSFTVYMFIYKPFYWPNSQELQRFMW